MVGQVFNKHLSEERAKLILSTRVILLKRWKIAQARKSLYVCGSKVAQMKQGRSSEASLLKR